MLSTFTTSERDQLFSTLIRILEHYLVFLFLGLALLTYWHNTPFDPSDLFY